MIIPEECKGVKAIVNWTVLVRSTTKAYLRPGKNRLMFITCSVPTMHQKTKSRWCTLFRIPGRTDGQKRERKTTSLCIPIAMKWNYLMTFMQVLWAKEKSRE